MKEKNVKEKFVKNFPGLSSECGVCTSSHNEFYGKGEIIACYYEDLEKHCIDRQRLDKIKLEISEELIGEKVSVSHIMDILNEKLK